MAAQDAFAPVVQDIAQKMDSSGNVQEKFSSLMEYQVSRDFFQQLLRTAYEGPWEVSNQQPVAKFRAARAQMGYNYCKMCDMSEDVEWHITQPKHRLGYILKQLKLGLILFPKVYGDVPLHDMNAFEGRRLAFTCIDPYVGGLKPDKHIPEEYYRNLLILTGFNSNFICSVCDNTNQTNLVTWINHLKDKQHVQKTYEAMVSMDVGTFQQTHMLVPALLDVQIRDVAHRTGHVALTKYVPSHVWKLDHLPYWEYDIFNMPPPSVRAKREEEKTEEEKKVEGVQARFMELLMYMASRDFVRKLNQKMKRLAAERDKKFGSAENHRLAYSQNDYNYNYCKMCDKEEYMEEHIVTPFHRLGYLLKQLKMGLRAFSIIYGDVPIHDMDTQNGMRLAFTCIDPYMGSLWNHGKYVDEEFYRVMLIWTGHLSNYKCQLCDQTCEKLVTWLNHIKSKEHIFKAFEEMSDKTIEEFHNKYELVPALIDKHVIDLVTERYHITLPVIEPTDLPKTPFLDSMKKKVEVPSLLDPEAMASSSGVPSLLGAELSSFENPDWNPGSGWGDGYNQAPRSLNQAGYEEDFTRESLHMDGTDLQFERKQPKRDYDHMEDPIQLEGSRKRGMMDMGDPNKKPKLNDFDKQQKVLNSVNTVGQTVILQVSNLTGSTDYALILECIKLIWAIGIPNLSKLGTGAETDFMTMWELIASFAPEDRKTPTRKILDFFHQSQINPVMLKSMMTTV